ncbi:MAG: hypothetical protein H0U87_08220 [Acidobacteria bacterium]|nr:hypothetical protein [Acidobacteriota bacterium]
MNYFNYFSEIEEAFIRRRGRNLLLSPLDWALIETWQERKVPLHVVLSGIEQVFDKIEQQSVASNAQKRAVKSLMYCREEIEAQHAAWLERQVGKNGEAAAVDKKAKESVEENSLFSAETIAKHLRAVFVSVEKARKNAASDGLRETLATAANELARLEKDFPSTENLEQILENLDSSIDERLLSENTNSELKTEIRKQLAGYKNKMATDIYSRTFDLMLLKRLREQSGIPRISLFYL